jgi:hypothetical protein
MHAITRDVAVAAAVRDGIARAAAIAGLGAIAAIHLVDLPGKLDETPYMAWMYVVLIASCVLLAAALWRGSEDRAWAAAGTLALEVIVGYVLSRATGLLQASDDIGNWTEPLGLASLFAEGAVVALAAAVLAERRAPVPALRLQGAGR